MPQERGEQNLIAAKDKEDRRSPISRRLLELRNSLEALGDDPSTIDNQKSPLERAIENYRFITEEIAPIAIPLLQVFLNQVPLVSKGFRLLSYRELYFDYGTDFSQVGGPDWSKPKIKYVVSVPSSGFDGVSSSMFDTDGEDMNPESLEKLSKSKDKRDLKLFQRFADLSKDDILRKFGADIPRQKKR